MVFIWRPSDPSGACIEYDHGILPEDKAQFGPSRYEEMTCLYPWMRAFHFDFEVNHRSATVFYWMRRNPWAPILAVALYGIGIFYGTRYFKDRKPWNWRKTMACWNLCLSVVSGMGFLRTFPAFIHLWSKYSFDENFCINGEQHFGNGSVGLWIQLFVLSKIPELFDTFFIVIHKKPLIFLHWYHHVSVLLYCWHSYTVRAPQALIFCVMNYGVHCIMYFYYFLMAVGKKPRAFKAVYITVFQLSQMVVGVTVTAIAVYVLYVRQYSSHFTLEYCHLRQDNNLFAMVMYGSYLFLFLDFFLKRYFGIQLTNVYIPMPKDKVVGEQVSNGKKTKAM